MIRPSPQRDRDGVLQAARVTAVQRLAASAQLARDAAEVVALLERFGDLLTDALDAAGRGADDDLAAAVAERARVTVALGPRLAALGAARRAAHQLPGCRDDSLADVLRPVDDALQYAQLLHLRVTDDPEGSPLAALALVR